jgi:hypothetical protein
MCLFTEQVRQINALSALNSTFILTMAQAKSKSAKYYAANPTAAAKKAAYQRKLNKKPTVKNASEERWTERRRRGVAGKGGHDLSHTKDGRMVLESPSKNRARNGHNGKSTKK